MKPETRYALFILALSIIWRMLLLITGWVDAPVSRYLPLPIFGFMLIGMFRGMEERRKLDYSENFHFPGLFKSGMSITALFSLMYSLFLYVYIKYIDVEFKTRFVAARVVELRNDKTPEQDIAAWQKWSETFPLATIWILFTFIGFMVMGAFYSGVITRMMRRKHASLTVKK